MTSTPRNDASTDTSDSTDVPRLGPSVRSQVVRPFEVMDIVERVAQMRAEGREVISLCVGEPAQGAPAAVRARAAEAMTDGTALGYSQVPGVRTLRSAIAGHYADWYDMDVDPSSVFVTTGSSGAFALSFLAAFDAGDRVALARPGYAAYKNILAALGCEVVELECGAAERFQPTVELLEAAHASAPLSGLMLASPANPTGTMLDAEQMRELTEWCAAHGVRVVSDEIYHGITFTGSRGETAWAHDRDSIVISSFSKYWGMTGWRLGWALIPADLRAAVSALAGNLSLCAPVPAQHAAVEAFSPSSYTEAEAAVAGFAEARARVLAAIPSLGWQDVAPADGAFYVYARIDSVLGPYSGAREWCAALLEAEGVAVSPGVDFDTVHGDSWVRLSLAVGAEAVAEALVRIARFQESVAGEAEDVAAFDEAMAEAGPNIPWSEVEEEFGRP